MTTGGPFPPDLTPDPRTPEPDPVALRVEAALRSALDAEPVDVRQLRASTRQGVARARVRRRSAIVGAGLLVAAVPFGASYTGGLVTAGGDPQTRTSAVAAGSALPETGFGAPSGGSPGAADGPADLAPHPATATPAPTAAPLPGTTPATRTSGSATAAPTPTASPPPGSDEVAYEIPDAVALRPEDFPRPMTLDLDTGQYNLQPTVPGQGCGDGAHPHPVAGRQWQWSEPDSDSKRQLQVALAVTGWAPGSGQERFRDLVADEGRCRFPIAQTIVDSSTLPGKDTWAATGWYASMRYGRAAVRVGDRIVGVEVSHPDGENAAVVLARELVTLAAARLQAEAPA